ncbi:MAG: ornithine cyclodeaminase family protein [Opitutaceae bacterium]
MTTKLLSTSDIEAIIVRIGIDALLDELIEVLETGFAALGSDVDLIPPRSGIHYTDPKLGLIEWMPASIGKGLATLKLVGYHPSNPQDHNLPTVISSICVFETTSGHLKGLLDGTFLTALRTGAMAALATKTMGDPMSKTLGIIGCGAQAVTQVHALSRVMNFDEILAYDLDAKTLDSFGDRIAFTGIKVRKIEKQNIEELLEQSDVLCTCTSEEPRKGPLFKNFKNRKALHINAIGADFPEKYEVPLELLERAFVCPDFYSQAIVEGECQQLEPEQISHELALLLKKPELFNQLQGELTVFDSTGHAFSDYLTSLLFLDYAERFSLGTNIALECIPRDPKDPYSFLSKVAILDQKTVEVLQSTL